MYISKITALPLFVALVIGFGGGYIVVNKSMQSPAAIEHSGMTKSMDSMTQGLEGKTGAELERIFLDEMVVHHRGAIEMAHQLKAGTTRPELLKMADDIIRAQSQEVEMMEEWKDAWFTH